MSISSARLPAPKIDVTCTCGKRYRVPAKKAGKTLVCKSCKGKIRIAREAGLSERSRGTILAELGIDAIAAEQAYKDEVEQRSVKRVYRCTRCAGEIASDEIKGAYVAGELVCPGCRASDLVADRKAEREAEEKKARGGKAAVELITDGRDARNALFRALSYGTVFFIGTTGPLWAIFSVGFLKAFVLGALVAALGAAAVYRARA
jgi:predicted metal-binding protein